MPQVQSRFVSPAAVKTCNQCNGVLDFVGGSDHGDPAEREAHALARAQELGIGKRLTLKVGLGGKQEEQLVGDERDPKDYVFKYVHRHRGDCKVEEPVGLDSPALGRPR
jgi:hypothetical protein